jgi:hypothetical protein
MIERAQPSFLSFRMPRRSAGNGLSGHTLGHSADDSRVGVRRSCLDRQLSDVEDERGPAFSIDGSDPQETLV